MNTVNKHNSVGNAVFGLFLMVAFAATLSFGFVQTAHAQDYGGDYSYTPDYGGDYSYTPDYGGGYDYTPDYGGGYSNSYDYGYNGGCCDYSYTPDSGYSYTPDSGYSYTPDSGYSYTADSGYSYTPDAGYSYIPDAGYTYTPDAGYTFTPDTYSYGSGYSGGFGGYGGGGGYTNVNTNSNYTYSYNNCVGTNNCNTANTVITNPSPTVTYTSPTYSYPSYPSYSYSQPYSYTPPVIITSSGTTNPYVSLSSIPYTGLELGFWGTLAYWGFVILWCLFAAYLVVVKRVQNKFMAFLFGKSEPAHNPSIGSVEPGQASASAYATVSSVQTSTKHDAIDSFIMGQIQNRARA